MLLTLHCTRTSSVSSAQIADVVSPTNRAAAFGILFAAFSIGYCVAAGIAPLFSRVRPVHTTYQAIRYSTGTHNSVASL